ncbi:MAG: OmpP1/FadL family transporter [Candidatus Binatia bacterium]
MNKITVHLLGTALCVSLFIVTAWAGGAYVYELGTPDLGTAAAGRAALAQDASTVVGNPAGMIRLDHSELSTSLYTILPSLQFRRDSGTTVSGGNGFNAGTSLPSAGSASIPIPAGGFFYAHSLSPDWKLGVGFGSGFGAGLQYGKEWAGRYYTQKSQLLTFTLNPGVAYRVNNWLSIGAGFSVTYALLSQTAAVNNILDRLPDGRLKFKDDDFGFGGNVGLLLELSPRTRVGLTYRSPMDFSYKDTPKLTNVGPGLRHLLNKKVELGQTAPQTVMLSGYHQLTDQLAVMGNFGWQNWKEFGEVDVTISSESTSQNLTSDAHFHDTWHGAIGMQYRIISSVLFSAGFAYDSSPVSKFHRTPSLPVDRTLRFGSGLQYVVSEATTIGLAYEFFDGGSAEIANLRRGPLAGTVRGHSSTNYINFVSLNMIRRF